MEIAGGEGRPLETQRSLVVTVKMGGRRMVRKLITPNGLALDLILDAGSLICQKGVMGIEHQVSCAPLQMLSANLAGECGREREFPLAIPRSAEEIDAEVEKLTAGISTEGREETDAEKVDRAISWSASRNAADTRGFADRRRTTRDSMRASTNRSQLLKQKRALGREEQLRQLFGTLNEKSRGSIALALPKASADAAIFSLDIDASNHEIGPVLAQCNWGAEQSCSGLGKGR
ncbi:unnamed protein product [Calicophoron daubneyi]|uniref:Uncharacterized protein n=1 Tax=Calicophoron daubneyi TaxID=300641 RepID=A0AAV2TIP0_CALDB